MNVPLNTGHGTTENVWHYSNITHKKEIKKTSGSHPNTGYSFHQGGGNQGRAINFRRR